MTEKLECFECGRLVTPIVRERTETLPVRGEPIEVLARVAVCPECNADMSVEELDDATLVAAFNLYRQKHGLMTPEEMKRLRERYGLGVRPFSLLLGWGERHLQSIDARDYGHTQGRSSRLVARETRAGYGSRLVPDVAISPGETIQELLEERGIARAEFAKRLGRSEGEIDLLLGGDASLSHQLATDLERVLGVPAIMWENLEAMYRALLRRDRGRSSGK